MYVCAMRALSVDGFTFPLAWREKKNKLWLLHKIYFHKNMGTKRKMHRDTIHPISISGINNKYKRFSQYQRNQKKINTERHMSERVSMWHSLSSFLVSAVNRPLNPRIYAFVKCNGFNLDLFFHSTISINQSENKSIPQTFNPIWSAALAIWKLLFVFLFFMILKQKQT